MRVVHISKVAGIAGSERHLLTLLPALRMRGMDVGMIVLEESAAGAAPFIARLAASGVTVERVPISRDADFGLHARLTKRLTAMEPDIVHTHLLHADLYGLRAARALGITATVSSRHNTDRFRHNPFIRWMNRRAMQHAARIIAISRAVARFVVSVEGCDASRVVTIPYGVESRRPSMLSRAEARARFGFSETDAVVGVVARLTQQKGVDVLVKAFAGVRAECPRVKLLIVGDGPDRQALELQVASAGLSDRTTFAGWVDEAWTLMSAADIIAIPSRWEGFCLAAVEAMAAGRPVVASDVDALSEVVVANQTGLLVPPADAGALAGAIRSLLADPARATRLGEQGARRAANDFPIAAMLGSMSAVYSDVLSAVPATSRLNDRPEQALSRH